MLPPTEAPALPGFLEVIRQVSSQFESHQETGGGRIILSKNEFVGKESNTIYHHHRRREVPDLSQVLSSPQSFFCMGSDGPLLFRYGSAGVAEDDTYLTT